MKKARTAKLNAKVFRPLNQEEYCLVRGADGGGLLAFPFIQQAMQGTMIGVEAAPDQETHG
jgi:hypothetical protein